MPRGLPDSFLLTGLLRANRRARARNLARIPRRGRASASSRIFYKVVNVTLLKPVINFELKERYGMVARHLHKIGNRVQQRAKRQVGVKSGALKASISMRHLKYRGEAAVKIGGYTSYALMHHQGTRPHTITPNPPKQALVFTKGARIIHAKVVNHPGTSPNRYLTDQLRKELLR